MARLNGSRIVVLAAAMTMTLVALGWSRRNNDSQAASDEVLLDFGDEASRRSILSFANTGARFWSMSLMENCAHGSDERYRLTVDGLEPEPLLLELIVQTGNGSISQIAPRWHESSVSVTPTAGYIVLPPPAPEPVRHQQDTRAPELSITYAVTPEQLAVLRGRYAALMQSGIPVVTRHFGIDGSTWVVETCVAGRYGYFARWSPHVSADENRLLMHFAAHLLELAHRQVKFVD